MKVIIRLSEKNLELLSREISGSGGWQSLLRRLQQNIKGHELVLNIEDVERIIRYALDYGSGGYEDRLFPIVKEIMKLANTVLGALSYETIEI